MIKLSGWHRLWILVVVLYFFVVGLIAWIYFPSREDILRDYADELIELDKLYHPQFGNLSAQEQRKQYEEKGLTDQQIVDKILISKDKKFSVWIKYQKVQEKYEKQVDSFGYRYLFNSFLLWLIPSIFIYILGYGIGWVQKGFKNNQTKKNGA